MIILSFIRDGGFIMIPLLILSIFAFGLILEKLSYFQKFKNITPAINQVLAKLAKADLGGIEKLYRSESDECTHLLRQGIQYFSESPEILQNQLKQAVYEQILHIHRYLDLIQVLANIMPMLGLLGTVTGIISVFRAIHMNGGGGDLSMLSGGISEALITTQTGLLSAIIITYFHSFLATRANQILMELNRAITSIQNLSHMKGPRF